MINCSIGDVGMEAFCEALGRNGTLKDVNLT